jgi:hypothetical protein
MFVCFPFLQMIWVCILCRKKQELLIKTGTWMQSTAELSTDPILRRIEQDMIATPTSSLPPGRTMLGQPGSNLSTPQNPPLSPATSTISSLFSKAMSFAGTPTMPTRPRPSTSGSRPPYAMMSSGSRGGRGGITRQRSLDSSDSGLSPCGYPSSMRPQSRLGMAPPSLSRHRSAEGGDELDHASNMSGGEATPTATVPFPLSPSAYQRQSPRFRPPNLRGGYGPAGGRGQSSPRPYLTRGRSLGESPTSMVGVSSSISFHNRPVTSSVAATPIRSTFIEGVPGLAATPPSSCSRMMRHPGAIESMSAPEDAYHESPSSLYPRVLVSDSEARDVCLPLSDGPMGLHDKSRLMDPRSMAGRTRRKLDSTFRNDSLSSDQSECLQQQRPPPPKPHKHKKGPSSSGSLGHLGHHSSRHSGRPFGVSSSDEEIRSTPECTSCGEEEMESESVSEKGKP